MHLDCVAISGRASPNSSQHICPACEQQIIPAGHLYCARCDLQRQFPSKTLQHFFTFISGVPHPGQQPLFRRTPIMIAFSYLAALCLLAVAMTTLLAYTIAVGSAGLIATCILIYACYLPTISGMLRGCHNYILHHASHKELGRYNDWFGEFASTLANTVPLRTYRRDHGLHHRSVTSVDDPDQIFLESLGFHAGQSPRAYWSLYLKSCISPNVIANCVSKRWTHGVTLEQSWARRAGVVLLHWVYPAATLFLLFSEDTGYVTAAVSLSWFVPLTLGYHVSQITYALGLHVWHQRARSANTDEVELTGARFCLDRFPTGKPGGAGAIAGAMWWLKLLFIHLLLSRCGVLGMTDNGSHDAHHFFPSRLHFDWCHSAYARRDLFELHPNRGWWNTWSISSAIKHNFVMMSSDVRIKVAETAT